MAQIRIERVDRVRPPQRHDQRRPPSPSLPDRLWTHEETAAFLGLSTATLHDLNYKRTGPRSFKVGRYRRYDPRDVQAWLDDHASDVDRDESRRVVHNLSPAPPRAVGRA
ncbi:MAG TPA: helix-turn-helix domain-containing protein [Solirubrobacteraceae bacterium]|nr:helix-turn-helix domain-containing protein [Solirubrobacteraceae bacterium]